MNGFFGKVSSHGDFVSRRLPPSFLQPWDAWLQAGLRCSRERLGEQWLEVYLCSPIWRFALAPGVCGDTGWAGVMIPSVDRVGRYFPLTLATAGPDVPLRARLQHDGGWYAQLESLALSALHQGFSLQAFDEAVRALAAPGNWPQPRPPINGPILPPRWLDLPDPQRVGEGMPPLHAQLDAQALPRHSLFWTEGSPRLAPSIWVGEGLPDGPTFADMLGGPVSR